MSVLRNFFQAVFQKIQMKNICFHQLQPVQIVEGVDRTPHLLNLFFVKNLNWYARTLITTLTQLIRGRLESKTELHQDPKLDARNHGPNSIVSQKLEVIFKDCVSLKVLNKHRSVMKACNSSHSGVCSLTKYQFI